MKTTNNARYRQIKAGRMEIVAQLYRRGYSISKIAQEVRDRLNMTCSTRTIWNDINSLLSEWRETRIEDMDKYVQLELERIDECVRELWEQWEKSKSDYSKTRNKSVGLPTGNTTGNADSDVTTIRTVKREQVNTNIVCLGDVSYIAEIRQQLAERRKLLGLYAPEKKDVSGSLSFASLLVESGMLQSAEEDIEKTKNA